MKNRFCSSVVNESVTMEISLLTIPRFQKTTSHIRFLGNKDKLNPLA